MRKERIEVKQRIDVVVSSNLNRYKKIEKKVID
jgi:hypothetical protein